MYKKTITSDFFTTLSFSMFLRSLWALTIKLPVIKYGKNIKKVEDELLSFIWVKKSNIYSFYNWRTALYQALKIIWIKNNDEIIVSWYTCVSVSNAVIQAGGKIVYSDINKKNLGLSIQDLEKNISKNTKVIIVQHTFWKPSEIKKIINIAKKNWIIVIEDCAHSLWSKIGSKMLWLLWDFSIFSTWRDKVISSVTWWFLIVNNKKYFPLADKIYSKLKMPSILLIARNLNYNLVAFKAYKTYDFFKLWRALIFISRKLKLITEILSNNEKKCSYNDFNYRLPNSLSYLALRELELIKSVRVHRRSISEYYEDKIINKNIKVMFKIIKNEKNNYFRLPILVKTEKEALRLYVYMRLNGILLWKTWLGNNIVPIWTNNSNAKYKKWSCPIAEDISKRILLLPNHWLVSPDEAKNIVRLLNNFEK